jgi:hypothetical protein
MKPYGLPRWKPKSIDDVEDPLNRIPMIGSIVDTRVMGEDVHLRRSTASLM